MSRVVHGFTPRGDYVEPFVGTACGATWGARVEGGLRPFGTSHNRTVPATDFGEVTCRNCIRTIKGAVQ